MAAPPRTGDIAAHAPSILSGIGIGAGAFALYSGMDTLVKWLTGGYTLPQIIFLNSLFALIPMTVIVLSRPGGVERLRTTRLPLHLLRGVFGLCSGTCAFFAYASMPLADAYAVAFSAPLFITALSVPLLKEQVGWRRWSAVAVGFAGILVMLRPGAGVISLGALAALGGALFYSCSVITVRFMGPRESSFAFALYSNLVCIAATGVLLPFVWVTPDWTDLGLFLGCGLLNGIAFLMMIVGYQRAPAAVVAPFQYTQMLWGMLAGYLVWGDLPDEAMLVGGSIVIASGLYILHREAFRRRERAALAPVGPRTA